MNHEHRHEAREPFAVIEIGDRPDGRVEARLSIPARAVVWVVADNLQALLGAVERLIKQEVSNDHT